MLARMVDEEKAAKSVKSQDAGMMNCDMTQTHHITFQDKIL